MSTPRLSSKLCQFQAKAVKAELTTKSKSMIVDANLKAKVTPIYDSLLVSPSQSTGLTMRVIGVGRSPEVFDEVHVGDLEVVTCNSTVPILFHAFSNIHYSFSYGRTII
ncbi:hypothetical protein L1887_25345 [Cichorium endivia]|nr:hypothetical protein L1887_25345 [Cichorium endivia]